MKLKPILHSAALFAVAACMSALSANVAVARTGHGRDPQSSSAKFRELRHGARVAKCRASVRQRAGSQRDVAKCARVQYPVLDHAPALRAADTLPPAGYHVGLYANLRTRTGANLQQTAGKLAQAGVQFTREIFSWTQLEPQRAVFRWQGADAMMSAAASAGLHVMATPAGIPSWISSNYSLGVSGPVQIAEYAEFVRQVVERYGSHGTFWLANPKLPKLPIELFDIWNEPYTPAFWGPSPDAATYARTFEAAVIAGRTADPQAKFLLEANPGSFAPGSPSFLDAMFAAAPDLGRFADAVSIHPYASDGWSPSYCTRYSTSRGVAEDWRATQYETCRIWDVRNILDANSATATKIWITEIGYSTSSGDKNGVSDAAQASYVDQFFSLLRGSWKGLVAGVQWYQYQADSSSSDYGLVNLNGAPKPAWSAFVNEVSRGF